MSFIQSFLHNRAVKKAAIIDANLDKSQVDDSITALIGRRPAYEPQTNPTHLALSRAISPVERTELEDDLRDVQSDLAERPSLLGMNLIGALLFVVEVLGALLIMKALGLQNPERTVYAIALASSLFFLTSRLARAQERPRKIWFTVLLLCYGALVIGIASVRLDSTAGDEFESRSFSLGSTIVMLATTIVPAFFFERIWATRVPVAVLKKKESGLKRRLFRIRRDERSATRKITRIAEHRDKHIEEEARLRAHYSSTFARHERLDNAASHFAETPTTAITRRQVLPEGNIRHELR